MKNQVLITFAICLGVALAYAPACHNNYCTTGEPVEDSVHVPVLLAVKQRNLDILDTIFQQVTDPKSPRYGQYMSQQQVGELTSDPKRAAAVIAYFLKEGVSKVRARAFGSFVQMLAPVRVVESLFSAKYLKYTHVETNTTMHRSLSHKIPSAIAEHIDFVAHVSDFPSVSRPQMTGRNLQASTDALVEPSTIWQAYGINDHSGSGIGNMSVFETTQDYSPSDLSKFLSQYNLPSETVAKVIGPNTPFICLFDPNSCGEANLDVQYIIGVAQNIPLTFWSISSNDNTPFYDWIVAVADASNPPLVHSMSYGEVETQASKTTVDRTNTELQKMGARGLTIVISSGDDGVAGSPARSNAADCGFNPSWPASSPYVLAVGATQFKDGSTTAGEIPCQSNNNPASLITTGGGFSALFSQPSYQSSAVNAYLNSASLPPTSSSPDQFPSPGFNKAGRGYPDVAALGHHYQVVIGGKTYSVDGTSCSAPVTAGMLALINDALLSAGKPQLGFINPFLYSLAESNPNVFTDITTGNNRCTAKTCCTNGFNGAAGWDPLTGLGTINFQTLKSAALNN